MKVEVAVQGFPSLINKTHGFYGRKLTLKKRTQDLCESRGGCPRLPVPNKAYGFYERKATLNHESGSYPKLRSCVKVEVGVLGSPSH